MTRKLVRRGEELRAIEAALSDRRDAAALSGGPLGYAREVLAQGSRRTRDVVAAGPIFGADCGDPDCAYCSEKRGRA